MRSAVFALLAMLLVDTASCGSPPSRLSGGTSGTAPATGSKADASGSALAFRGNKALSTAELTTAIAGDEEASSDILLRTLLAAYFEAGHVLVKIRASTAPSSGKTVFQIKEGPRFRLGKIAFADPGRPGAGDEVGKRDELRGTIRARQGEWFRRSAVVHSIKVLDARFRGAGYAEVNITPLTKIDTDRRVVEITFDIERGPRAR